MFEIRDYLQRLLPQTYMKHVETEYSHQSSVWTLTSYSLWILIYKNQISLRGSLTKFHNTHSWLGCLWIENSILC